MKLTNLTTALVLVTSACGVVVDDSADPGATSDPAIVGAELGIDGDLEQPPAAPPSPLLLEAPRAATTPGSLFAMTFASGAPIADLVAQEERGRIDVVEQKITTVRDEEIHLVVELAAPTGTYARTLVSDALRNGGTYADRVLCESNNIATYDPRCESAAPAAREMPSTGDITTSTWKLTVIDDVTGVPLGSCIDAGPNKVTCTLPARASASYRILASAHGFANLWDGSPGFGQFTHAGTSFVGGFATQSDWQCWDFPRTGTSVWCGARYEFIRFTAIDRAQLELDPITLRVTANGSEAAMATPALSWDSGNDDVPGPNY
jgi:hypothetical protein